MTFQKYFVSFNIFFIRIFQEVIAHSEDGLIEALNHYYIVSAHIIETTPQGKYKVCFDHHYSLNCPNELI